MVEGFMYDKTKEQELKEKISHLTKQIKNDTSNAELYFERALEYYQLSQQYFDIFEIFDGIGDEELYFEYVNKAYSDVDKALSFKQEINDYAYSFKLFMLKKLKRWEDVIEYGMKLHDDIGCTTSDCALIGEAYFNLQDWENCIDFYTMVIDNVGEEEANNIGVKIFMERGVAYSSIKKPELALKDYLKHIELNEVMSFDYYIYRLIAYTYDELNNHEEAIAYYTKAIETYPEHAESYYDRGKIYLDVYYEYSLAAEDFDKAIEYADEDNYFYYHNCGYSYVNKGEKDEHDGNYELALQDYDRAIEAYKKAVPLDPTGHDGSATVGYAEHLKNELLAKMDTLDVRKEQDEEIVWNEWRSNLQNQIMKDVKLPTVPNGTVFKFTFTVDKDGRVTNIKTWSTDPTYTPYAILYIASVIRDYQGNSILNFPPGSSRDKTEVMGGLKVSSTEKYSTPQDYNDIEK